MRRRRKKGKIEDLVEKELHSLLIEHEPLDNKNFNKREINVNKTDDTIPTVKEHETIIKIKTKGILNIAYKKDFFF